MSRFQVGFLPCQHRFFASAHEAQEAAAYAREYVQAGSGSYTEVSAEEQP